MSDKIKGAPSERQCKACQSPTVWREGRKGWFHGCSRFPACKSWQTDDNTSWKTSHEAVPPNTTWHVEDVVVEPTLPETAPTHPAPAVDSSTAGGALWAMISPVARAEILQLAQNAAQEVASRASPSKIEWTINDQKFATIEGAHHKALGDVLKRVKANLKNILIVGPAGSGKTQLAADLALSVDAKFASLSCTSGMPEWHLTGRSMPNLQTGESVYQRSQFVERYEEGGVFLLDEVDAADPNVLLVMNSALANGHLSLAARTSNPTAKRHPDFILIAAANTFGTGASRQYVGRNQLDASTLSRFACAVIEVDYDTDLENSLCQSKEVLNRVWQLRNRATAASLRRVVGTRELLAVDALVRSGESLQFGIEALTTGWTPDEKTKAAL